MAVAQWIILQRQNCVKIIPGWGRTMEMPWRLSDYLETIGK
jgi:hypothetical protein